MEESQSPEAQKAASLSATARLGNIFVEPGIVFEEVKAASPSKINWIVPLIIAMVAGAIYALVVYSQPAIIQKLKEAQEQKMQAMVKSGKISQAGADQAQQQVEKFMGPAFLKAVGVVTAIVGNVIFLFLTALVLWLLGKYALRADLAYMRVVEIAGLALMITSLGMIISTCLAVIFGSLMATPSPALLLGQMDPTNRWHAALSALNVMSLWHIAVLSIGLAKLCGVRVLKPALWLYGIWAVTTFGVIAAFGGK